jgi:hypothetical protein
MEGRELFLITLNSEHISASVYKCCDVKSAYEMSVYSKEYTKFQSC